MNKTISELRAADLPRATVDNIGLTLSSKDDSEEAANIIAEATLEINRYLASFTPGTCPGCGAELGGIFGTFRWGVTTGEGTCCRCGYPARGQHACKNLSGSFVLPYHPEQLATYRGSPEHEYEADKAVVYSELRNSYGLIPEEKEDLLWTQFSQKAARGKPWCAWQRECREDIDKNTWTCAVYLNEGRALPCPYEDMEDTNRDEFPCMDVEAAKGGNAK